MTNEQPLPSLLASSGKCNDAGRQENGADHPRDGSGQTIEGDDAVDNLRKDSVQVEEMAEEGFPVKVVGQKRRKKPYKELTLDEKVQLIRLAERCSNLSQANIAERYEIAKSNVCRILQRKDEYIRALESAGFSGSRKRKLRTIPEEEKQQPTQQQSQQRKPAAETGEEEEPGGEGGEVRGGGEFGRSVDVPGGGNAHCLVNQATGNAKKGNVWEMRILLSNALSNIIVIYNSQFPHSPIWRQRCLARPHGLRAPEWPRLPLPLLQLGLQGQERVASTLEGQH
jgi:hypothetical protein